MKLTLDRSTRQEKKDPERESPKPSPIMRKPLWAPNAEAENVISQSVGLTLGIRPANICECTEYGADRDV